MRERCSSTRSPATQVIEPTENTAPPPPGSWYTTSAPPFSGLVPLASKTVFTGEDALRLSVSCPDAPPGTRSCNVFLPKRSPFRRLVPSNAQCDRFSTRYGAAVISPAELHTTPNRLASDSSVRCIRLSYSISGRLIECPPISPLRL